MHVGSLLLRALLGSSVVVGRPPDLCVMSAETPPRLPSRESHSAHSLHPPAVAVLRDSSRPGPD